MVTKLHLDILPDAQKSVWNVLQKHPPFYKKQEWCLAGGTALALQIGHRQSNDFDFFSENQDVVKPLETWLSTNSQSYVLRDRDRNTLHAELDHVKVSFIVSELLDDTLLNSWQSILKQSVQSTAS